LGDPFGGSGPAISLVAITHYFRLSFFFDHVKLAGGTRIEKHFSLLLTEFIEARQRARNILFGETPLPGR